MACSVGVINIGIEPTAHRKSLRFHRKATKKNYFLFSCNTSYSWKFIAKFKSENHLKNWKLKESELKNSSKTLTGIWYRYLAITSLDFSVFKNGFRIWIPHDISKKIMYHIYFLQDTTQENTPNFQIINQIKVYTLSLGIEHGPL